MVVPSGERGIVLGFSWIFGEDFAMAPPRGFRLRGMRRPPGANSDRLNRCLRLRFSGTRLGEDRLWLTGSRILEATSDRL